MTDTFTPIGDLAAGILEGVASKRKERKMILNADTFRGEGNARLMEAIEHIADLERQFAKQSELIEDLQVEIEVLRKANAELADELRQKGKI